ncbi:hypothetical protein PMPD1_2630 [Paramixta manurensis]|uniref:Nitric oxide reductase n=1 Tax=Paramixta manurensis TaxID=2740817 RepID=A0A6M8UF73_9GAMM|nr:hypothetical protein PMPD1_2630 [Erwiniaceae bacterium PD-1]
MNFDTRYYPHATLSLVMMVLFPLLELFHFPLYHGKTVEVIETFQSLWLLFGLFFTWYYLRHASFSQQQTAFWVWSLVWWLTLFGRGISWGRDYFHDGPKLLFRAISVILIGALVVSLIFPSIRREIVQKFKYDAFPLWDAAIVVICFFIADTVEHHRYFSFLFLYDRSYQDLMEELYETPFMISLFCVALYLMRNDNRGHELEAALEK